MGASMRRRRRGCACCYPRIMPVLDMHIQSSETIKDALISAVILLTSIVPTLNNTIDVRTCFIKCRQAGFMDIYDNDQCYMVL